MFAELLPFPKGGLAGYWGKPEPHSGFFPKSQEMKSG
jgi:hypothetical protein